MNYPNLLFLYTYTFITLQNNLRTLFVNHESIDKAAVAMIIKNGQFNDTTPGVSHLLEHMLLRGSEKYPDSDDFSQFLAAHNGGINAETHDDFTIFYFDVSLDAFELALDRFIWFFIKLLFDPSKIEAEISAVDSESKLYLNNEPWRIHRMLRVFTNNYNQYGIGDEKTLNIDGIRDKMIFLYESRYRTENMQIVIMHPDKAIQSNVTDMLNKITRMSDTIDQNQNVQAVQDKVVLFKNYTWSEDVYSKHVFDGQFLQRRIYIRSLK
ncbi:hypothetical protein BDAP_001291, partial [Binucleata daphniae]